MLEPHRGGPPITRFLGIPVKKTTHCKLTKPLPSINIYTTYGVLIQVLDYLSVLPSVGIAPCPWKSVLMD